MAQADREHVPEPRRRRERRDAPAHRVEAEEDQPRPEQHPGPGARPDTSQQPPRDPRPADQPGDQRVNVERGEERERGEADVAPHDDRQRRPRRDEPAARQADEDEGHRGRALHETAEDEPDQARLQRRMCGPLDQRPEARAGQLAERHPDQLDAQEEEAETEDQRAQRRGHRSGNRPAARSGRTGSRTVHLEQPAELGAHGRGRHSGFQIELSRGRGIFSKPSAARRSRRGVIIPHGGLTMAQQAKTPKPTMVATMRYDDAGGMIEWLGKAFGFERHFVVPGDNGTIAHAQLVFGSGMIMLGTARAKAAGAEILYGPRDTDYGSREYAARDPEGHIWSFGTYDPWA